MNSIEPSPNSYLWGLAFSSGNFATPVTVISFFQIDMNDFSVDTVAQYDGLYHPPEALAVQLRLGICTLPLTEKFMSLVGGVRHIHEINYPDSAGIACDVQQHAIDPGDMRNSAPYPTTPITI
ncbi:MAG: hypothetical protein IPG39_04745 [Bacteroidetes bacterium]|nr:hypothetical protein [Bacteroidota bacterium]